MMMKNEAAVIAALYDQFGSTVKSADLYAYDSKLMAWARAGGLKKKSRGVFAIPSPKATKAIAERAAVKLVDEAKLIRERFDVLAVLADGVAQKNVRSLIVAGAPGVGKTHTLEARLSAAEASGQVKSLTTIKGSISPIGLFVQLWENRDAGQVLMLDDIDAVFADEEAMNLLKGALDTTKTRRISWAKASSFLRDNDIPNTFEYNGQIVFITNTNPDAVIEKGGKLAPHMAALVSRSVFLDLCIHSPQQVMVRVEQVVAESSMLDELGLTKGQAAEVIGWMNQNLDRLRAVSLRTVIQLASFIKTSPNWVSLAQATMLKGI